MTDVPRLGPDEQRAMRVLFDRVINLGRKTYGEWRAANETRDMATELRDELVDGVWYAACEADARRQRQACQQQDRIFDCVDGNVSEVLR